MNLSKYKYPLIRTAVITLLYAISSIAISYYKNPDEFDGIWIEKAIEIPILFIVVFFLNLIGDKRAKNQNKSKFYKDLDI